MWHNGYKKTLDSIRAPFLHIFLSLYFFYIKIVGRFEISRGVILQHKEKNNNFFDSSRLIPRESSKRSQQQQAILLY